jgi:hypothetical protein
LPVQHAEQANPQRLFKLSPEQSAWPGQFPLGVDNHLDGDAVFLSKVSNAERRKPSQEGGQNNNLHLTHLR